MIWYCFCPFLRQNRHLANQQKETAILLLHCTDQRGIVAAVTKFIDENEGNIINLDEHVDRDINHFYMRVEWELDGFQIPREKISEYFETIIGNKYDLTFEIKFSSEKLRMAIFVSQYSHCLFDILARYEASVWKIEIPLIISNHEKFRAVADRHEIPFFYRPKTKKNKLEVEKEEYHLMKKYDINLIVLARYMQIISGSFCERYYGKMINIHHSTLPAFAGANPYKAAYNRGVKFMGATAHYVTEELDGGPIICQGIKPISHVDSIVDMKRKGRDIEKIVLADAIWAHINHKIIPFNNKTVVFP